MLKKGLGKEVICLENINKLAMGDTISINREIVLVASLVSQ